MENKYIKSLVMIAAFLVLSLVTTASYAYFTARVKDNLTTNTNVITSGYMALELEDGPSINFENMMPGTSVTKTFKVKNTGTVDTEYSVYLSELLNNFIYNKDIVYTLESTNGCSKEETVFPNESGVNNQLISSCPINAGETHNYNLIISYINRDGNQDKNKGCRIEAKLSINSYIDRSIYAYIYDEQTPATLTTMNFNYDTQDYDYEEIEGTDHTLILRSTKNGDEEECVPTDDSKVFNCESSSIKNGRKLVAFYNIQNINQSNCNSFNSFCDEDKYYEGYEYLITSVDIQEKIYPIDTSLYFADLYNVKNLDLTNLDTSATKSMIGMFRNMVNLESLNIDNLNTDNCYYMNSMFKNLKKLTNINLSNFNTPNLQTTSEMFSGMENIESINVSSLNTSKTERMDGMFKDMKKLKMLDLSGLDTSKVGTMNYMFKNDISLEHLNVSTLNTNKVKQMSYMFEGMTKIKELDLSSFDTRGTKYMNDMFKDDISLEKVIVSRYWSTKYVGSEPMFENCYNLVGDRGMTYDPEKISSSYAHMDCGGQSSGYFTFNEDESQHQYFCDYHLYY